MIALIQVRSDSTRFPGKYKAELDGKTLAELIFCSVLPIIKDTFFIVPEEDREIQEFLYEKSLPWFCGPFDPLLRYWRTAKMLRADNVIRLTGDCPLIDPARLFYLMGLHTKFAADFTSNCHPGGRTEIDGNDVEIMSAHCLDWLNTYARGADREHVTAHLYANPKYAEKEKLRCVFFKPPLNLFSLVKTSIDTPEDLEKVRSLYVAC